MAVDPLMAGPQQASMPAGQPETPMQGGGQPQPSKCYTKFIATSYAGFRYAFNSSC